MSQFTIARRVRLIQCLVGGRGLLLFLLGTVAALALSLIECAIAFFLVTFLCSLGFADASRLPAWWPLDPNAFSSMGIWLLMLGVAIGQAAGRVSVYQSKILFTERVHARLRLLLGYLILKKERLYAMPLSRINFYMSECFPKATSFVYHTAELTFFAVQVLVMTVGMYCLAWREAVVGTLGLVTIGITVLHLNRFTNRMAKGVPEASRRMETTKLRVARNWILIKVLRLQNKEYGNLLQTIFLYYRHSVLSSFFGNLGGACMPVLGVVTIAAMVMTHFWWSRTPPSQFIAFLYLFVRLQQRLAQGSNMIGALFTVHRQFDEGLRLTEELSAQDRREAFAPEQRFNLRSASIAVAEPTPHTVAQQVSREAAHASAPLIELDRVCFSWPDAGHAVLRDLSLRISPGEQLGIVGPNGSGKSTLLGIVLGIFAASSGRVRVDGADPVAYFDRNADGIAYVGPEPYLVHGSVHSNLTYGLMAAPADESVWQALRTVGLDELVKSLPRGLEHVIHEDGAGLSSGEKQRLTIARAFLRLPRLLVLDEPAANLDEATETAVVDTLEALKGHCTTLIVSHRIGILQGVDRKLVLEGTPRIRTET